MSTDAKRLELIKLRRLLRLRRREAFDPFDPESRPSPEQLEVLRDAENHAHFIVAANRVGKTNTGGRIVSWFFNEEHPHIERPAKWGVRPLTILVVGRTTEQLESEIWEGKIKPFLDPADYDVDRSGGGTQAGHPSSERQPDHFPVPPRCQECQGESSGLYGAGRVARRNAG